MVGDQVKNGQHEFADYPSLGFTANSVVVTTNNFGFNNGPFRYAQIVSMPKTQLYDDPTCTKTVHIEVAGGNQTKNPDGSKNKFKWILKDMPREGYIGLSFHDKGKNCWYKNLKVKELGK